MWTRLFVLALVPLLGIGVVAIPQLVARATVADGTRAIDERVMALRSLVTLQAAVTAEIAPTEAALRAGTFGFTLAQASMLLGFDVGPRLETGRADVDVHLTDFARFDAASAAEVRRHADAWRSAFVAGATRIDDLHGEYLAALAALDAVGAQLVSDITAKVAATSGQVRGVVTATRRLNDAYELSRWARVQVDALFRAAVPGASKDTLAAHNDIVSAQARLEDALLRLHAGGSAELAQRLDAIAASAGVRAVSGAVARLVASVEPTLSMLEIGSLFRSAFARSDAYDGVVRAAADEATTLSALRRTEASSDLRRTSLLVASLLAGAAGLAVVSARSITRRLRPLAVRAAAISEGVLDGPAADERGPREIAVVAHALNETVAGLRQVEEQAGALARGDLDADVLASPAPGALGASVHATFERLAEAWRDREDLQERLAHQANHDLLTRLPNRKGLLEALDGALARAQRHGDAVAVLFVDLDEFKRANDAYGHHAGDRILQLCAQRLGAAIRAGDLLARLGGDEFVVVSERLGDARAAVELAERLIAVVSEPFEIDGISTHVGASVGVGMSLDGRTAPLELLRDADHAVHRAKRVGKGRVEIFDEHARDELEASNALELALRRALADDELRLHYQPITDTATGRVRGFEALARWTRDGKPVSPADFVAVAEQSDLVNDLGRWALATATRQLRHWTDEGIHTDAYVAVNISGRHLLHASFPADVRDALAGSGLEPTRLVVEITETVVLNDLVRAAAVLTELRSLGVRVALDDFGTGYTSIGHLWRLPVDVLKIDGAYVRNLGTSHEQVLVELMIEVAHTLGLGLVAEGVETQSQFDALRNLACDAVQGYHIARPQPPELVGARDVHGTG